MTTKSIIQEDLINLSSQLSKMIKRSFGKGPDSCFCTFDEDVLIVRVKKFITPAEQVLLEKNERNFAQKFRSHIISDILDSFKEKLRDELEVEFDHFYHDWNFDTNTGFILFINANSVSIQPFQEQNTGTETLKENITRTFSSIYKQPGHVQLKNIGNNIVIAHCQDTLLPIEKELFEQGNYELLYNHMEYVKSGIMENKLLFDSNFQQGIQDIFLLWDYDNHSTYLVFYLNKASVNG
ncbi:MAG: DUF2294 domain-containing protein [Bacillus sp. (in: Bacteria)]|nr:DUF2294 domain-containing protein [Bacillus sp. (in: firmicutes)]